MSVLPCQIGDGIRIVIIGLEKWIEQDKQRGAMSNTELPCTRRIEKSTEYDMGSTAL